MSTRYGRRGAGPLYLALWWGLMSGCGEPRELELFPKKTADPAPPKSAKACGGVECPPERGVCVAEQCVECDADRDCGAMNPACVQNTCVACRVDDQCPKDKVCHAFAQRCTEPCKENAECKDKNRKLCDVERGWCVTCLSSADCTDNQTCDPTLNSCVACGADDDCGDAGICNERRECVSVLK